MVDSGPQGLFAPTGSRRPQACRLNRLSGYGAMAVMKPADERSTRVGISPTAAEGTTTEIREETDRRRRRLVIKGASALPMLLTLRSGALAAQSCTGVQYDALTKYPKDTAFPLAVGEGALVNDLTLDRCDAGLYTKVNGGTQATLTPAQISTDGSDEPVCTGGTGTYQGYYCSTSNVAIVSSGAFASMGLGGRV